MGKALKDVKVDNKEFYQNRGNIDSMTPAERRNHNIFNGQQEPGIAIGSGTSV
jgi:signal recognition particle GTPase